ncbi:MAG: hypothetical protein KGN84_07365 [Acidobacteriota bacterium]|nr:hypothetical protein [Acidobacteriota bacterium]
MNVIQYRRIAATLLGIWLGAGVFADIAVTRNFTTVDRFLTAPGSTAAASEIQKIGAERLRPILRRNAGEENNGLFADWETAELAIGAAMLGLLFAGGKPAAPLAAMVGFMLAIVAAQRFYLSPLVTDLGRQIADLPPSDPLNARFWMFHGIYSGVELAKLLAGFIAAIYMCIRKKQETEQAIVKETPLVARLNG